MPAEVTCTNKANPAKTGTGGALLASFLTEELLDSLWGGRSILLFENVWPLVDFPCSRV